MATHLLETSVAAIAPSNHRPLRVRNVNIDASMPQSDRVPAMGSSGLANGDQWHNIDIDRCKGAT